MMLIVEESILNVPEISLLFLAILYFSRFSLFFDIIGFICLYMNLLMYITVQATAGPMSSSVEGLIMMTRAFSSTQMFYEDPTIPHIPLDESVSYVFLL